jgi:hypothetical protein
MGKQQSTSPPPAIALSYHWQRPYINALLEADRSKLQALLPAAETAVKLRMQELQSDDLGTPEERQAIEDALACLRILRQEAG